MTHHQLSRTWRLLGAPLLALLTGCGLAAPSVGTVVAPGVARAAFETRIDGTDLVRVSVYFPADDAGRPLPGPRSGLVYLQGGAVAAQRYGWQAEALAARGLVVALPEHPFNLAILVPRTGEAARRLLARPPVGSLLEGLVDERRLSVAGHSLGGVVALKLALAGGFEAAVVQASYPDRGDAQALQADPFPTLLLAGSADCTALLERVQQEWPLAPSPTALLVLEGVTHYQFTDAATEDEASGCVAGVSLAEAHARIAEATARYLDAVERGADVRGALSGLPAATLTTR